MTEQEKYIAGQKKCGIEVGDEVRATRHFGKDEGGSKALATTQGNTTDSKSRFIDAGAIGIVVSGCGDHFWVDCGAEFGGAWAFPYFVLEIVKKANGSVPGKVTDNTKEPCRECKHLDSDVCDECPTFNGSCTCHTGNPPCSYCEGSLWEELIETISTNRKERNMKTQEIFSYVASVALYDLSVQTNLVEKERKDIIVSGTVAAYDTDNAKLQVMALVLAARPDVDTSEVSVLVHPFCG